MIQLSVNVNKVATLRNARGGNLPDPVHAALICVSAGARSITVHPRADQRHIRPRDVRELGTLLRDRSTEFNVEGDPTPEWLALVHEVRPTQASLVPVREGEITSEAGWCDDVDEPAMQRLIAKLRSDEIRVSLFIDATVEGVEWAARMGADRVELYTAPFAVAFSRSQQEARAVFELHCLASQRAHALGVGVNAGHDLDLDNLVHYRELPHLLEVSIGHALISHALLVGLDAAVREYRSVLSAHAPPSIQGG